VVCNGSVIIADSDASLDAPMTDGQEIMGSRLFHSSDVRVASAYHTDSNQITDSLGTSNSGHVWTGAPGDRGKRQTVEVRHGEGVANRTGPE
jgi:hypothetical protein